MNEFLLAKINSTSFNVFTKTEDSNEPEIDILITSEAVKDFKKVPENSNLMQLLQPLSGDKAFRLATKAYHERLLEFKLASGQITAEAVNLFKHLGKTMMVTWYDKDIIMVMDQVLIPPPYTEAKLSHNKITSNDDDDDEESNAGFLGRVQRILDHYHKIN